MIPVFFSSLIHQKHLVNSNRGRWNRLSHHLLHRRIIDIKPFTIFVFAMHGSLST